MRGALKHVLYALIFLCWTTGVSKAELAPAVGTSVSVTPSARSEGGGSNLFFDVSGSLGVPIGESWYFLPSYALGISKLDGVTEPFSIPGVSLKYTLTQYWELKPAYSGTFSHKSDYRSHSGKFYLSYLFPEPSSLVFSFGPSLFRDTDANRKAGGFAGLSGSFTERWFGYGEAGFSSKISENPQNNTDYTLSAGIGHDITEKLSGSFGITLFRGSSGLPLNQSGSPRGSQVIGILAKRKSDSESETIRESSGISSTEITFTFSADYRF